MNKSELLTSID